MYNTMFKNIQEYAISKVLSPTHTAGMLFKAQIFSDNTDVSGLYSSPLLGTLSALTLCNHFHDCLELLVDNIRLT